MLSDCEGYCDGTCSSWLFYQEKELFKSADFSSRKCHSYCCMLNARRKLLFNFLIFFQKMLFLTKKRFYFVYTGILATRWQLWFGALHVKITSLQKCKHPCLSDSGCTYTGYMKRWIIATSHVKMKQNPAINNWLPTSCFIAWFELYLRFQNYRLKMLCRQIHSRSIGHWGLVS